MAVDRRLTDPNDLPDGCTWIVVLTPTIYICVVCVHPSIHPSIHPSVDAVDLTHLRTVKPEEHLRFSQDHSAHSYFFSAKTKEGFMQSFSQLAAECLNLDMRKPDMDGANVSAFTGGGVGGGAVV